ncbi:hypothetical protein ACFV42_45920 [Streptomyces solisilvae]|uniref:hypothetical protein n=1 Tax=Streptomyces malaysiensis TaxID=92644 RepID=UPI0036B02DCA
MTTGIKREFRNPTPVKQTAETVQQAFGRERVLGHLLAVKLHVSAHKVPVEAGLGRAAHVSLSESAAQREARIHLSVTLAETPGLDDDLPLRVREALAPFLTALAFPVGGHGAVDERLLNTGPVRLTRARPRI